METIFQHPIATIFIIFAIGVALNLAFSGIAEIFHNNSNSEKEVKK